ncbi:hypothetical protein Goklo_013897, partial [Gossypium klotzschianum]|nr:hypothetical protein [Gossypium klotzschianum]
KDYSLNRLLAYYLIARNRHYAPSTPISYSATFSFFVFHFLPSSSSFRFSYISLQ